MHGQKHVDMSEKRSVKKHRWYLGGFASAGAAVFTHPLDLMKVRQASVHAILQMFSSIVCMLLSDFYSLCSHNSLSEASQQWCSELASIHLAVNDWSSVGHVIGHCRWLCMFLLSTLVPQYSISSWPIVNDNLPMFISKGSFLESFCIISGVIVNICTQPMN